MTREEHIENLKAIASDMPSDKCADWIESLMAGVKALEQVSSSEKPNKWIPCSERLPEEHKEVLTCSLGGFIEIQSYEDGCGGYWENQKGDWSDICEVVAWMPLPEQYKQEVEK